MSQRIGPNQRLYAEPRPENRTEAERDHDRILYTSALQRLAGITQIAAPESGLTIHNRLTHTPRFAQTGGLNPRTPRPPSAGYACGLDLLAIGDRADPPCLSRP